MSHITKANLSWENQKGLKAFRTEIYRNYPLDAPVLLRKPAKIKIKNLYTA